MQGLAGFFFTLVLAFPLLTAQAHGDGPPDSPHWRIAISSDVYSDYLDFIGQRDPLSLQHYGGPHSRRDVVEVVLLQQALQRGGAYRPLRFLLTDSERRTLKALANGDADMSGSSQWSEKALALPKDVAISRALVREGEFTAGLYFPEGHPALLQLAAKPQEIHRYTAVCAASWKPDLAVLGTLGSPVLKTENWESMLGMLQKKRADYVLAPFQPTPGFRFDTGNLVLAPVPGIKVRLPGSRHFLLSRHSPDIGELESALEKGLKAMEKEGRLQRAYQESGFHDDRVKNWKVLQPSSTAR